MPYQIEILGLKELLDDVVRAGGDATRLLNAAATNSADKIQSTARQLAPHRTGTLQRSIMVENDYPEVRVKVNEIYGGYIESGTGIYGPEHHRIVPKTAKALRWVSGGKTFFAKSVAGMKARPFFAPAIQQSMGYIQDQFVAVAERLVKELAGHQ